MQVLEHGGYLKIMFPLLDAKAKYKQILKEDMALVYEDWKECILPLLASDSFELNPDFFGVEQYFAAKSLIASRSFEIDDYHGFGMVPLADLFATFKGVKNKPTVKRCEEADGDLQDSVQNVENFTRMSLEDLDLNKKQSQEYFSSPICQTFSIPASYQSLGLGITTQTWALCSTRLRGAKDAASYLEIPANLKFDSTIEESFKEDIKKEYKGSNNCAGEKQKELVHLRLPNHIKKYKLALKIERDNARYDCLRAKARAPQYVSYHFRSLESVGSHYSGPPPDSLVQVFSPPPPVPSLHRHILKTRRRGPRRATDGRLRLE
ncbi:hypothetical protein C3L33_18352, partial [Rhododendron williamsianum]